MARKNQLNSGYQRQLTGDQWFNFYKRSLTSLVVQMFEWKGLPETINPIFVEKSLHHNGLLAFYNDKTYGHIAVTGTPMGINPYGEATRFQASMYQYHRQFDLYQYVKPRYIKNSENLGVLVKNQIDGFISSQQAIVLYASLLAENRQTKLISQNALKIPYVFVGNQEQMLTMKNIFYKLQANEPVMFVDEEQSNLIKGLQVMNTNAPYHLDKLTLENTENYNEFLTHFGINNVNINKKERLVTSEATANDELILNNRNKFLAPRKETARILSELWDTEITVDLREGVDQLVTVDGEKGVETIVDREL